MLAWLFEAEVQNAKGALSSKSNWAENKKKYAKIIQIWERVTNLHNFKFHLYTLENETETSILNVCGDIYCRPYIYCHRQQFMPVLAAHIVASKHTLSPELNHYHAYIVIGDNTSQNVPHILSPHFVKHFKKIIR